MSICDLPSRGRWIAVIGAAVLLFSLAAYATPTHAQGVPGCPIRITLDNTTWMFALPSFGSRLNTQLASGEVICMIGRTADATWVQFARPNTPGNPLGWAAVRYFYTTVPITSLPVTNASGTPTTPPPVVTPPATSQTYIVQVGDTLSEIAQRFGVTLTSLAQMNNILPPAYVIYVGQTLVIPGTGGPTTPTGYSQYVVQPGDFLLSIAIRYNQNWRTLATINGIQYPYIIYPGQTLLIPSSG